MVKMYCPYFLIYKIKCDIKLENWVKFNYAYHIFLKKSLGLYCLNVLLMRFARLMHTTLSVSHTQIIPLFSLTCQLVLYGCFNSNI